MERKKANKFERPEQERDEYIQTVRAKELETTGLMGNCKYSENKLREEQGLNIRIKY